MLVLALELQRSEVRRLAPACLVLLSLSDFVEFSLAQLDLSRDTVRDKKEVNGSRFGSDNVIFGNAG